MCDNGSRMLTDALWINKDISLLSAHHLLWFNVHPALSKYDIISSFKNFAG